MSWWCCWWEVGMRTYIHPPHATAINYYGCGSPTHTELLRPVRLALVGVGQLPCQELDLLLQQPDLAGQGVLVDDGARCIEIDTWRSVNSIPLRCSRPPPRLARNHTYTQPHDDARVDDGAGPRRVLQGGQALLVKAQPGAHGREDGRAAVAPERVCVIVGGGGQMREFWMGGWEVVWTLCMRLVHMNVPFRR